MDYIKIRFGSDFDPLGSSLEKTIDEIFRPRPVSPMFASSDRRWNPQMDIIETPEEIILRAEMAGVTKENLEVEINNKAVRISGQRSEGTRMERATYRLAEIQYGRFERFLFLPCMIDTEVVSSSFSNGFLEIRLAKLQPEKSYKIPIEEG